MEKASRPRPWKSYWRLFATALVIFLSGLHVWQAAMPM